MPRPTRIKPVPSAFSAGILVCLAIGGGGCAAVPRDEADPGRAVAEATGIGAPVQFIAVGPEGGPIDEPDAAGPSLSLPEALRRAVTTDPGLQAAMARVRAAAADSDQARLVPNPVLNVVLRWGGGPPQIEASLAQDFIAVLQIPRRASAADNRLRAAAAAAVTGALDVAADVQERYASAQASAALVPLFRERLALLEKLAVTAAARLDAGEGTRGDITTLRAQRVELELEIDIAQLAERENRLRLARLIGEPGSGAAWTLDPWSSPERGTLIEQSWIEAGLQHRPEIQEQVWRLRALGDDAAVASLLPWDGAAAGVDAQRDDGWAVGPSVSSPLPVFDSGSARGDRLTAEQMEARHHLTLLKRTVVEEVRLAFESLNASAANVSRIRRDLLPLQTQRRQLAEDAYRAGQSDVTSLYLAEHDLRLAQTRAIEVERQAAGAMVRLCRAAGGAGVAASLMTKQPVEGGPLSPERGDHQ